MKTINAPTVAIGTLGNISWINGAIKAKCFEETHHGVVHCVAAGWGLDTEEIKKLKESKGLIVCAGTAARALIAGGVEPDFIVYLDGSVMVLPQVTDLIIPEKTFALMHVGVVEGVANKFPVEKRVVYGGDGITEALGIHDCGGFDNCGTVAMVALDFSVNLGAHTVTLHGYNFSYSKDGESYAKGTHKQDDKASAYGGERLHNVESWDGKDVVTTDGFLEFQRYFSQYCENHSNTDIIQTTPGGLSLGDGAYHHEFGWPYSQSDAACQCFKFKQKRDIAKISPTLLSSTIKQLESIEVLCGLCVTLLDMDDVEKFEEIDKKLKDTIDSCPLARAAIAPALHEDIDLYSTIRDICEYAVICLKKK